jgi:outer membrane receptor protein involved in Fe transport
LQNLCPGKQFLSNRWRNQRTDLYDQALDAGRLNWFAVYSYQDDHFYNISNTLEEKGYGLLNANLTFTPASEKCDVSLTMDNTLDEEYAVYRTDIGLGQQLSRGMPRLWKAMYNYQDDQFYNAGNTLLEDGYGILNAKVTFTPESQKWDLALAADNLTDEDYDVYRTDIGLGEGISIGMPLMWRVVFNLYL